MGAKAERLLEAQAPTLLVGSPMCTAFSTWQFINHKKRDSKIFAAEKKAGLVHLSWMCKLYMKQAKAGRLYFFTNIPRTLPHGMSHAPSKYCNTEELRELRPTNAKSAKRQRTASL